jgi:hypothetical protein
MALKLRNNVNATQARAYRSAAAITSLLILLEATGAWRKL